MVLEEKVHLGISGNPEIHSQYGRIARHSVNKVKLLETTSAALYLENNSLIKKYFFFYNKHLQSNIRIKT